MRSSTGSSRIVVGLIESSFGGGGGGGGREEGGGGGGKRRSGQRHPGGRPGGQTRPDTREAPSLSEGSLPKSYTASGRGTPDLSRLTIIVLIGCIHASLSSKGTPTCLHRP